MSIPQFSHQPSLLKVANHSPFASEPQNTPFHGSIKGGPSGAIKNVVCQVVECEADVMTQRD